MTGTSTRTPTTVASATGEDVPKRETATATDNSKKLDAPIIAAGAMIYVVIDELIPEMAADKHSNSGIVAFAAGFVLMMILDVALG